MFNLRALLLPLMPPFLFRLNTLDIVPGQAKLKCNVLAWLRFCCCSGFHALSSPACFYSSHCESHSNFFGYVLGRQLIFEGQRLFMNCLHASIFISLQFGKEYPNQSVEAPAPPPRFVYAHVLDNLMNIHILFGFFVSTDPEE